MIFEDDSYPYETSANYIYDEYDISSHSKIILGKINNDLGDKLKSFQYDNFWDLNSCDFSKYIKNEVDFSDFFIEKTFELGYIGDRAEKKYSDSPYVYLLGCSDGYGAILGMEPRPGGILVNQIQGFLNGGKIWHNLKYADFLLNFAFNDLRYYGIPEIWVLPYFRNQWKSVRENFQNSKKRQYDIPARREGFLFDEEGGIWRKSF